MFFCSICYAKSWDTRSKKLIKTKSQWVFPYDLAWVKSFLTLHYFIFIGMEESPPLWSRVCVCVCAVST